MTEESAPVLLDFKALLEAAPDGIAVVDKDGVILVVNEQLCLLFGYSPAELMGQRVEMLVPARLRNVHVINRRKYGRGPTTRPMGIGLDLVGSRKDGWEFPIEISLSPVNSNGQSLTIATVRDVTERRRLQAEQSAMQTILETEEERYRIGMDLHDGIMQDIYAVSLALDLAFEDIDTTPGQAKETVSRSIGDLHNVIRDIRSYIFDLRPRQFRGDLGQALLDLGREFQDNSSIKTEVRVPDNVPEVHHDSGVALYVIAHEALSNTRKYSQASRVDITLHNQASNLMLEIRDDGCGFEASFEFSEGHRGLRNMASRANLIGGRLEIESAPGAGTAIRVELPLR